MGPGPSQDESRDLKKEIEALIIHLLCFKHKMKNVVWTKGTSGLEGKFQSGSEVHTFTHSPIHPFQIVSCSVS
jgi:translation initiation factor 3 subunit L